MISNIIFIFVLCLLLVITVKVAMPYMAKRWELDNFKDFQNRFCKYEVEHDSCPEHIQCTCKYKDMCKVTVKNRIYLY